MIKEYRVQKEALESGRKQFEQEMEAYKALMKDRTRTRYLFLFIR